MGEPYDMTDMPSELGGNLSDWAGDAPDPGYDPGAEFGYDPGNVGAYTDQGGMTFDDSGQAYGPDISDPGADWALDDFAGAGGAMTLGSSVSQLAGFSGLSIGGQKGFRMGSDTSGADIDFGDLPGPRGSQPPYTVMNGCPMSRTSMILRQVAANVGMRIRARTILYMIARLGWQAAARSTGLAARDLLYLFLKKKQSRRGRLGPHLRTIEKRCRAADRYRHRVAKLAGRIHATRGHAHPFQRRPSHHRRRRAR